jgi:hypothetical protein
MPDEVITQPQAGAELATQEAEPIVKADEFDKERAMATIEKLRLFEKQAKSLEKKVADYEQKERERQDAELSETEKLKKQLAEKDTALKNLAHKSLQHEIAEKVGLPAVFAERLKGENTEEMEADAKLILEALPKAGQPKVGATNPGANATGQSETDEQKLARIHGRSINIFDPVMIKKTGGGVDIVKTVDRE